MPSLVLSSKVVGYSRGKKIKNPYRARLIEFKNGEYGVAIDEKIGGKWSRVPSGWSYQTLRNTLYLPSLNKFLDQVFVRYEQGWVVRGMSGVMKEATKLLKRRGLRRNPIQTMGVYGGRDGFEITDFKRGDRIQMHPGTDLWMRGARYGWVLGVGKKNLSVKLDYLKREIAVSPRNIGEIVSRQEIL